MVFRMAGNNGVAGRRIFTRVTAALLALIVTLQSGCVSLPEAPVVPETRHQASVGKVAVVAAVQAPEVKFEGFVHGKGEGAVQGAGNTFGGCMRMFSGGGCSGDMCGVVVILGLVACAVVTPVGAVVGAVAAPSAKEVDANKAKLTAALEAKMIQEALRDKVVAAAIANRGQQVTAASGTPQAAAQPADYRSFAQDGIDTVLEVAMTKIATTGSGINPPLALSLEARSRLIRTSDNRVIFSADYVFFGGKMTLSEWSANQGERFVRALNTGFETLGSHIYDNAFLLYPFPSRIAEGNAGTLLPSGAFGLLPIYPTAKGVLAKDDFLSDRYTKVDSVQPTLHWQSFPRPSDVESAPGDMGRVKNVRYDLVIAREYNWAPSEIVYRGVGLPSNEQRIENLLLPGVRYFWSVRARFDLDGRERVTEWASLSWLDGQNVTAPSLHSYRFRTPQ